VGEDDARHVGRAVPQLSQRVPEQVPRRREARVHDEDPAVVVGDEIDVDVGVLQPVHTVRDLGQHGPSSSSVDRFRSP
jgi:hypothetical protein